MMITCTRRSGLMLVNPFRMTRTAPECFKTFSSRMAPKMMWRMLNVMKSPSTLAATTCVADTCQAPHAIPMARM